MNSSRNNSANRKHEGKPNRRAAIALELIAAAPVFLISLLSIVQLGLSLSGTVLVHQAAVVGAQQGSMQGRINATALLPGILSAVNQQLSAAGVSTSAADVQVLVQERLSDPPVYTGSSGASGAGFQATPSAAGIPVDSIRVTVNVRLSKVTVDLLSSFGYLITGDFITGTALRPYNGI
jgi:Flp pilus assembly protein TadG